MEIYILLILNMMNWINTWVIVILKDKYVIINFEGKNM